MIGFTAQVGKKEMKMPRKNLKDVVMTFDSGMQLTLDDLVHHLLVLGTTGSGKSLSVILPATHAFLMLGCRGLVIDVKGNFGSHIDRLAAVTGRARDIVKLGISPTAMCINVISNMGESGFYEFVKELIEQSFGGKTGNMDFHVKGASMARDCLKMLRLLEKIDPVFEPTIPMIAEMFNDYRKATELFELFRKKFGSDPETAAFIQSVDNSRFHILSQTKKKLDGGGSTHFEQLNFGTEATRVAFKAFLDTPGIIEHFCRQGGGAPYMGDLLQEEKIVVLRFGPSTGPVGARLARLFMNSFYQAIYELGLTLPGHSFVCVDEFQEVADLSNGRYSDSALAAQAREFKVSGLFASQSASALQARGADENAVRAFMSNCNNKVMFFSDDPLTRSIASNYDQSVDLIDLKPGEAFVTRYDSETREHLWGRETLSNAYEMTRAIPDVEPAAPLEYEQAKTPTIGELVKVMTVNQGPNQAPQRGSRLDNQIPPEILKGIMDEAGMADQIPPEILKGIMNEAGMAEINNTTPHKLDFVDRFSDIFTSEAYISVPMGWRDYAAKIFALIESLGLQVQIERLEMTSRGALGINTGHRMRMSGECDYINRLLDETRHLCMMCGKRLPEPEQEDSVPDDNVPDDNEEHYGVDFSIYKKITGVPSGVPGGKPPGGLCPNCLEAAGWHTQLRG